MQKDWSNVDDGGEFLPPLKRRESFAISLERIEKYEATIKNVTSFSNAKKVTLLLEDGTIKEYENALLSVEQGDAEYYLDGYIVFKKPTRVKIRVFRDPIAKIVKYVRISIL